MKKLVLTKEEIDKYNALAKEFQAKSLWRRKTKNDRRIARNIFKGTGTDHFKAHDPRCPVCKRHYNVKASEHNKHPGTCCKACYQGTKPKPVKVRVAERYLSAHEKRHNRQVRRQIKIQAKPIAVVGFYDTEAWRSLRYPILRKFNFMCLACGHGPRPGKPLHVDHIKPRSKYPELELDPNNLQVLCQDCNLSKSNHFEDDLRPK